jgi:BolA family transcriptional regulator, general stress-responsive regulator
MVYWRMRIEDQIRHKLAQALHPTHLDVANDSARHRGHAGDDGSGQTHFRLVVVSESFSGLDRIARYRMVYDLLAYELANGLHAVSMRLLTPAEFAGK